MGLLVKWLGFRRFRLADARGLHYKVEPEWVVGVEAFPGAVWVDSKFDFVPANGFCSGPIELIRLRPPLHGMVTVHGPAVLEAKDLVQIDVSRHWTVLRIGVSGFNPALSIPVIWQKFLLQVLVRFFSPSNIVEAKFRDNAVLECGIRTFDATLGFGGISKEDFCS